MEKILKAFERAKQRRHRRLVVVLGKGVDPARRAAEIATLAKRVLGTEKVLYMAEFPREGDVGDEERYRAFVEGFTGDVRRVPYAKAKTVLGETYDALVLDAFNNFPPRDVGISVETVRGPGVVILLMPPFEEWMKKKLFFHSQYVVTPPYGVEDCGDIYQRRVVKHLLNHGGVYIVDEGGTVVGKEPRLGRKKETSIEIPGNTLFPREVYGLARTQDQVNVIKSLEEAIGEDTAYVILANRGRGKSAALGLFLAGLSHVLKKRRFRVVVTSPTPQSVDELYRFLRLGVKMLEGKERRGRNLRVGKFTVLYRDPLEATRERGDLLVVDEAAGIYVSILREYLDRYRSFIFSTTTHGYEGTGRLFQYRFLPTLREKKKLHILRMEEPIRYGTDDPVERWLYDLFLLDAEPASVTKRDVMAVAAGRYSFRHEDREQLFLRNEEALRQFIGIYVYAHYRNNPRDIAILSDAPNQNAFSVRLRGKVIGSLQVAEEGGLTEEYIYRMMEGEVVFGNIIPDIFLKYYGLKDFARLKGYRVVRIAVHPELQGKGIGSFALSELERHARERGLSWVGAGFGASVQVVRFWKRNGYVMVHVSPKRNVESGEYSTIFVKPLDRRVERWVRMANYSARSRLLSEMDNYYYYMEPAVALELISSGHPRRLTPDLSEGEAMRLKRYVEGGLFYDAVSDVVYKVVRWYFLGEMKPEVSQTDKLFLIEKVLKKKTWREAASTFSMDPGKFARRVDKVLARIGEYVLEEVI